MGWQDILGQSTIGRKYPLTCMFVERMTGFEPATSTLASHQQPYGPYEHIGFGAAQSGQIGPVRAVDGMPDGMTTSRSPIPMQSDRVWGFSSEVRIQPLTSPHQIRLDGLRSSLRSPFPRVKQPRPSFPPSYQPWHEHRSHRSAPRPQNPGHDRSGVKSTPLIRSRTRRRFSNVHPLPR